MLVKNSFESGKLTHSDGKMHHIGVDEFVIAKSCILTSNTERVHIIADTFDTSEKVGEFREYITYTGMKNGIQISTMSIGMGCMPTAIAVEELKHIGCTNLVKVGTCGAIQAGVLPGTIIIATGAVRGEGASVEYINLQYPAIADFDLLDALIESAKELNEDPLIGIVRTHDALFLESLFAHDDMEARIKPWRDLDVVAIENEASAMFVVSSLIKSRAGVVLVAVDNYTDKTSIDFSEDYADRINKTIEIAAMALAKLDKNL